MAFDAFLKLDGITGESNDENHKDEIEIESFSWGLNVPIATGGGSGGATAGRASFQDFSFTAKSSKASPLLFSTAASGKHINQGLLTLRGAGAGGQATEFYKVKLTDVIISLYSQGGSVEGDHPLDEFALNASKIEVNYDGVVRTWDIGGNKA